MLRAYCKINAITLQSRVDVWRKAAFQQSSMVGACRCKLRSHDTVGIKNESDVKIIRNRFLVHPPEEIILSVLGYFK